MNTVYTVCKWFKWEFALSLFGSSLFCSKLLILLSDCERFALIALKKEQIALNLLKKGKVSDLLIIRAYRSKKTRDSLKKQAMIKVPTLVYFKWTVSQEQFDVFSDEELIYQTNN